MVGGNRIMNDFIVKMIGGQKKVNLIDGQFAKIENNKIRYKLIEITDSEFILQLDNKLFEIILLKRNGDDLTLLVNNKTFEVNILTALQDRAYKLLSESNMNNDKSTTIKSPMPGMVLKICKNVGDQIIVGDTIMILEAMKMENEIKSHSQGLLAEIFVKEGIPIEKNVSLFSIK